MIKNIFIVRHGETKYNSEGRVQGGGLDSPLTTEGENQALLLSKYLKEQNFSCDFIYSSPLERSLHTARIVTSYMHKEIIQDALLKEISCGEYEGKLISELDTEKLRRLRIDPTEKYPGGECVDDVRHRGDQFLTKLKNSNGDTALVFSHGNFLRAFACAATSLPSLMSMRIYLDNTGFGSLFWSGEYFRISLWNSLAHLEKLPKRIHF
jgi:broad specificity phosphatase PhoE